MTSQSHKLSKTSTVFLNLLFGTLLVSSVTRCVTVFNIPTILYHHIASIRRPPVLVSVVGYRSRRGGFPKGCNSLFFRRGASGLLIPVTRPRLKTDHFFHPRDHICADAFPKRGTSPAPHCCLTGALGTTLAGRQHSILTKILKTKPIPSDHLGWEIAAEDGMWRSGRVRVESARLKESRSRLC